MNDRSFRDHIGESAFGVSLKKAAWLEKKRIFVESIKSTWQRTKLLRALKVSFLTATLLTIASVIYIRAPYLEAIKTEKYVESAMKKNNERNIIKAVENTAKTPEEKKLLKERMLNATSKAKVSLSGKRADIVAENIIKDVRREIIKKVQGEQKKTETAAKELVESTKQEKTGEEQKTSLIEQVIQRIVSSSDGSKIPKSMKVPLKLAISGDTSSVPSLIKSLKDDSWENRRAAAIALGMLKDKSAIGPLIVILLKDGDYDARRAAAFALGEIGDITALYPLIEALRNDKDASVGARAAEALGKIGDRRALLALIEALDCGTGEKNEMEEFAAEAIIRISRSQRNASEK